MARRKIDERDIKNWNEAQFDEYVRSTPNLLNDLDMNLEKYDEYDDEGNVINDEQDWKNVALDISKIPTLKFADVNGITFYDIHPAILPDDSEAAYVDAYSELNYYVYCYQKQNKFHPFTYRFEQFDVNLFIKNLLKHYEVPTYAYIKTSFQDSTESIVTSMLIGFSEKTWMYVDGPDKGIIYYDPKDEHDPKSFLHTLFGLLKSCKRPKVPKNKIYIVYKTNHGYDKMGFNVKKIKVDLEENYNDGFVDIAEKIIEGLNNKNKTNLVILAGDIGTGKTTFIRYLTSKLKKNIIFISPDMVDSITDPAFIPFLMKNNDSILIIEDAEPALEKRGNGGRSSAVSNVLNLTDGLLSDCLKISIVATFNTKEKNIDEALTRKGRLLMYYNFEKLAVLKSRSLLFKLGHKDIDVNDPMSLADIYYYDLDNNSSTNKGKRIGYGNQ